MNTQDLKYEKTLTGQTWESSRSRKRRRASLNRQGYSGNATRLLSSAQAFIERDDKARGRRRFGMIEPARGDGAKPSHKERQDVVVQYNESARSILGY